MSTTKFIAPLIEIQEQFDTRFQDFEILKNDLIIQKNVIVIEEQDILYRLKLCNLTNPFLLIKNEHGLQFFKLLSFEKYSKLI